MSPHPQQVNDPRVQVRIALAWFLLAAVFGLVLRIMAFLELPVTYKFLLHAHSHIALLGWIYLASAALVYALYLRGRADRAYRRLFLFTQVTLLGMAVAFPLQGYAALSIAFSTLFLFATYFLTGLFLKRADAAVKRTASYTVIRWSLICLVLSSLGPWALGGIMQVAGSESPMYRSAIYFYLHFLYNGWAMLTLAGLALYALESRGVEIPARRFRQFLAWALVSVALTFFVSLLWLEPTRLFVGFSAVGVAAQWVALVYFVRLLKPAWRGSEKAAVPATVSWALTGAAICLLGKFLLQTAVLIPGITSFAWLQDAVIGFLHLVFLGVITLGLFGFLALQGYLRLERGPLALYTAGFLLTEGLLFYRAASMSRLKPVFGGFPEALAVAGAVIVLALVWLLVRQFAWEGR